jgi:choline dehydrogenase-like flavoprotein
MNQSMRFDYVIVGGGSAGCVLAARLSEDPQVQVCLLEAGPTDWSPAVHVPMGAALIMPTRHVNWAFESEPQSGLKGRRIYQPRGKTLGGSSSINGLIYIRGHASDYDHWAALGNPGWSYDEVLPYFRKAEHNETFTDSFHGQDGPLNVTTRSHEFSASQAFLDATRAMQLPQTADFNGAQQEGFGTYQTTSLNGRRCSAARAYLNEAKQRSNLTIFTGAHATRVLMDGRRATGVEYRRAGTIEQVHARSEVILSAGALQSPQLLLLSGIGSAETLRRFGIDVIHDLPGVGENLQDHIDYLAAYRSKSSELLGISFTGALRFLWNALRYLTTRRGMLASNIAETGGFLRIDPASPAPELQFHFIASLLDDHLRKWHWGHGFSMHVYVCRPKSRGRVTLNSADPLAPPSIDPNYLAEEADLDLLLQGYKLVRRMAGTEPLKRQVSGELYPVTAQTDDELKAMLRQRAETGYHPAGTCKMGTDPLAVVDPSLRVHGIQGLRVVDASIMPTLVSGNTNAPAIMIGEKASDMIREAREQEKRPRRQPQS